MQMTADEKDTLERVRAHFDDWWESDGQYHDPDPRSLAVWAFLAGVASVAKLKG